ncbi:MAG: class II glutamine amidotransferase [Planctomycetes bacterium]|nr:class II glutamine amidotransferase [Planctomycetota bacterium]
MCRFVMYLGVPIRMETLVITPQNSLVNQSIRAREREEPLNGDGFGVAWYQPEVDRCPALFRSITPAWSNRNLLHIARVTRSGCILAHVRAASSTHTVTENNCHPFVHGPFAFMHNGDVGGFQHMRRALLAELSDDSFGMIEGNTDSEHLFALFVDRFNKGPDMEPLEGMATAIEEAINQIVRHSLGAPGDHTCTLNIAVTDGRHAVAVRFNNAQAEEAESLYYHTGQQYVCSGDVCRMVAPEAGKGAVIVSSEPLSDDHGWMKVPGNHMVLINERMDATTRRISTETKRP